MDNSKRNFIKKGICAGVTAGALSMFPGCVTNIGDTSFAKIKKLPFKISLAEWSLNKAIRKGALDHLDFAKTAKSLGIDAVEYVNTLFKNNKDFKSGADPKYVNILKKRASDEGVKSLLIMCDAEGMLGDATEEGRQKTVDNHKKWLDAAAILGCHSIRVNAASTGSYDDQMKYAAAGLHALSEEGENRRINVIVENHGGLSSNGEWLSSVMKLVNHPRCGTLPDFGNFLVNRESMEYYDYYKGMAELMPFAKGVSAKSYNWETRNNPYLTSRMNSGKKEILDYYRLIKIVLDSGYRGYIGIEYEGSAHTPGDGIRKTRDALKAVGTKLADNYI